MNNIEMLEDYIEALRKPKPFKYTNEQKAEAIENLIKENKELIEENEEYKADIKYLDERVRFLEAKRTDIIPKLKVKAKIEEKQENCLDFTLIHEHEIDTNGIIKVLQELLGEEFPTTITKEELEKMEGVGNGRFRNTYGNII